MKKIQFTRLAMAIVLSACLSVSLVTSANAAGKTIRASSELSIDGLAPAEYLDQQLQLLIQVLRGCQSVD
jgi:hypothetical protein